MLRLRMSHHKGTYINERLPLRCAVYGVLVSTLILAVLLVAVRAMTLNGWGADVAVTVASSGSAHGTGHACRSLKAMIDLWLYGCCTLQ